jgi:hypothetical protein
MTRNLPDDFGSSDLLKENDLKDIYLACRHLPRSKFCTSATLAILLLLTLHTWLAQQSASQVADTLRMVCDAGLNFGASILGFLIAGFTIFATMTRPDLLLYMGRKQEKQSRLSYLKYNYFALMEVFILYGIFVAVCLFTRIFLPTGSGLCRLIRQLPPDSQYWLPRIGYVFIGTLFFYLILMLMFFIWNVYHIVMTGLTWDMLEYENEKRRAEFDIESEVNTNSSANEETSAQQNSN